jgi:ketosteroid isomerase-like protein
VTNYDTADEIAALRARLQLLEDEREIQRTMARYGHSLDAGDEDVFMDCWAEGAVLEWPITGRLEGLDEIRRGFRAHSHAPEKWHKHLMVEPVIETDGDTATVGSMFLRVDQFGGRPVLHTFGRYADRLVRCPDGEWRFVHRVPILEALNPDLGVILARDC